MAWLVVNNYLLMLHVRCGYFVGFPGRGVMENGRFPVGDKDDLCLILGATIPTTVLYRQQ